MRNEQLEKKQKQYVNRLSAMSPQERIKLAIMRPEERIKELKKLLREGRKK